MADEEVQDQNEPERDEPGGRSTEPDLSFDDTSEDREAEPETVVTEASEPALAGTDPNDPESTLPPVRTLADPVMVPRWIQLVLLPLAIVGFYELAKATGSLVLVMIGAIVIAIILNPLVKHLKRHVPQGLAILLSWVIVWIVLAGLVALLAAPLANQITHIASNLPKWEGKANRTLASIQRFLNHHGIKVHITGQGQSALQTIEKKLTKSSGSIASFLGDVLGKLVSLSIDFVLTFVLSIYFLAYSGKIGELVRQLLPSGDGSPQDDYPTMIQKAVSGYVRAQLTFSLLMGVSCALILWILGETGIFPDGSKFTVFFGLFYALMELIPYIGPIIGPIPPILVALATHPIAALWLLIAFVLLQQLEGHVVAPQLFRIGLRINPILVILALLIGEKIFGIAGALLALPVATMIRQTILYLRAHLVLEQWTKNLPLPPDH